MSPDVQHETSGSIGRWFIDHADGVSAMTYFILSPQQIIADHTEVAAGHEGEGVGLRMLDAVITAARAQRYCTMPPCPFVNARRKRHPDWLDVLAA